jgi:ATP-dependent Clp protease ATP-binding subunit ClpA
VAIIIPVGLTFASRESRRVVKAARRLAAEEGLAAAGTGHLLVSLAEHDQDVAAFLLTLGSSAAAIRRAVAASAIREEATTGRVAARYLTAPAQAALMDAALRARSPRLVQGRHIFVGLCWGTGSVAGDVLRGLGARPGDWEGFVSRRGDGA